MTPKWQRARLLPSVEPRETIGALLWVLAERPTTHDGDDMTTERAMRGVLSFETNLRCEPKISRSTTGQIRINVEDVELLARDEKDFAETVELIPWEQFLAECRASR